MGGMKRLMVLAMLMGCGTDDGGMGPDAGVTSDSGPVDQCKVIQEGLTPAPGLSCTVGARQGLPASCTVDASGTTATCTELVLDKDNRYGVFASTTAFAPCGFDVCTTTPIPQVACEDVKAQLTPRPDLGSCVVEWADDLPATCAADVGGATATCSDLYVDQGGAIGTIADNHSGACRFALCTTTPN